jgi:outer membrane protein assembly factor BamB
MLRERARSLPLPKTLVFALLCALVCLLCVGAGFFAYTKISELPLVRWNELPTSSVAPPACAHETPHPSPTSLQDELFPTVMSSIAPGSFRPVITDFNIALCVLRTSDGAIIRHYKIDTKLPAQGMTQANGVLYFWQGTEQQPEICAMRASDGAMLWCQASQPGNSPLFFSSPLVINDGTLYVQGESEIAALRASDGVLLWQSSVGRGPAGSNHYSQIAVVNDSVYIPTSANEVCAVQASDGTRRWCTPLGALSDLLTLTADTTGAYVLNEGGSPADIVALSPTDGAVLWQRMVPRIVADPSLLLVQDGLLYLSTFDASNELHDIVTALQTSDGTTRWEATTDQSVTITVSGGRAYLGDMTRLQALQASTGKLLWKQSIPRVQHTLAGVGLAYVLDDAANLYTLRARDGKLLWERIQCVDDSGASAPEPHTRNGVVVWCTWGTDRVKYSLAAPTGLAVGA